MYLKVHCNNIGTMWKLKRWAKKVIKNAVKRKLGQAIAIVNIHQRHSKACF